MLLLVFLAGPWGSIDAGTPPNVLFICIDDLNDWVGSLGGHPQAQTPFMDQLAERGVNCTNAHCQAPICMPSRTSLFTGTYPHRNGVYVIEQEMRDGEILKDAVTLPRYFKDNGYRILRAGKIYHRREHGEADEWDFPALTTHHPGHHAVRSEHWRYIRYTNGEEELYDHREDLHEFHNLARSPEFAGVIERLARHVPTESVPYAPRKERQKFTREFDWFSP